MHSQPVIEDHIEMHIGIDRYFDEFDNNEGLISRYQ
jgi:hypothetical protein